MNKKDLTGQKFGKLTVIDLAEPYYFRGKPKHSRWNVKCECGETLAIIGSELTSGRRDGCKKCSSRLVNLIGKRVGNLVVVKRDPNNHINANGQNVSPRWICRCDCGTEVSVLSCHLINNTTQRCWDCKNKKQQLNGKMSSRMFHRAKYGAMKRHLKFEITKDYMEKLFESQKGVCALSGEEIKFADTMQDEISHRATTASLDRIDSNKGYIVGNVQWIHKDVNNMKWALSQDRFLELCRSISKRN